MDRLELEHRDDAERWGTIFMGPTSDRESSIDKVTNRQQCELWNRQAEAEYMSRVRARAAMRVETMLDKARTNSAVIRHAAQEWAEKVRLRWEDLHAEARRELEQARQLREEAERMRENAYAEGYQMGVEQAMMELDAHRAQLDGVTAAVLSAIQGQCPMFYESWREALSGLLREAVETSVGWVLTEEKAAVLDALLNASVQALESRQRLLIRVHPDDEAALQTVLEGAKQRFDEVRAWEVAVDPELHPGSLVVESASGKVDNMAEGRLGTVEQVLRHLTLPSGTVDDAAVAAVGEAAREAGLPDMVRRVAERETAAREEAERQAAEQLQAEEQLNANQEETTTEAQEPDPIAEGLQRLEQLSEDALEHPLVQPWTGDGLEARLSTHEAALPPAAPAEELALPVEGSPEEAALPPGEDVNTLLANTAVMTATASAEEPISQGHEAQAQADQTQAGQTDPVAQNEPEAAPPSLEELMALAGFGDGEKTVREANAVTAESATAEPDAGGQA